MRSARELNARKIQPRRHRRRKSMAAIVMDAHSPSCCPKLFILRALDILTRHSSKTHQPHCIRSAEVKTPIPPR